MKKIFATRAITLTQKIRGLIGKKTITPLYFETRFGIHTFGTQCIDVVILDETDTIRAYKEGLKTNRIFVWNPRWKRVLELPHGTIKKLKLYKGKTLRIC